MDIKEQKKLLRSRIRNEISLLSEDYRMKADKKIVRLLLSLPEYTEAQTVFCFVGTASEINTVPFLEQVLSDGKKLAVPLCTGRGIMEARRIRSLEELKTGRYGIREPLKDAEKVYMEDIDLAVLPCLACSHEGVRLGHGGGYYDRYFAGTASASRVLRVIICYERLICREIPEEEHDVRFAHVITETGLYVRGRRRDDFVSGVS